MMDAAPRWATMSKSHLKGTDPKIALEAIAHSLPNNPAGEEVDHNGQI